MLTCIYSSPVIPATDRLKELNRLLEDVAKIAVSTGPRGAIRFAQGIEAFVTVGGEYLFQLLRVSHLLHFSHEMQVINHSKRLSEWLVDATPQEFKPSMYPE